MKRRIFLLAAILLISSSLSFAQARKLAVVTFDSDAPYEHWKYGHKNFKIGGKIQSFGWGVETRFRNERKSNAWKRESVWKIIYSLEKGELYLWSATFTGQIAK
jgi:hypothetical protein